MCTLRSVEQAKKSTIISTITVVINVALNAVFIFGLFGVPKMGVIGVAIATIIARSVELVLCLGDYIRGSIFAPNLKLLFGIHKELRRDFIKYSGPALVNDLSWTVAFSTYSIIIGHLNNDMVAASSVATTLRDLFTTACFGISAGSTVILGKELGANELDRAKKDASTMCWVTLIFTAIMNIFYSNKGNLLFEWKALHIYSGGLWTALFIAIRIFFLIIASSVLTYTTTPTLLTDAIERLLSPLTKLHIDIHTFAMMMTLALRFIPTLMEEIERIMNAQKARGADFESGNFLQRAKALVPIMVPLIVSAVKRANELAFAMECRCYSGGQGRTRMKKMKFSFRDILAFLIFSVFLAGIIILNIQFPSVL